MDRPDASLIFQQLDRTERRPYQTRDYLRRFAWMIVQATLYRFSPGRCYGWRRFLLRQFGATLGKAAAVHGSTRIIHPWLLTIGDWSNLGPGVTVYNLGPVRIGNHTLISQDCYLCAGGHDYRHRHLPLTRPPITIGNGVWLCAGVFVNPGVTVGDNALAAARSVLTRDVPPGVIVGGNPAIVLRDRPLEQT
ncbi:MAG: putative colanic acid biosynthesis acetyltransferase [Phycisphaerae bacterium]|nr:putative colanic acid biosynthesis acetyltransferase [Phycisphaerae bacterium]